MITLTQSSTTGSLQPPKSQQGRRPTLVRVAWRAAYLCGIIIQPAVDELRQLVLDDPLPVVDRINVVEDHDTPAARMRDWKRHGRLRDASKNFIYGSNIEKSASELTASQINLLVSGCAGSESTTQRLQ